MAEKTDLDRESIAGLADALLQSEGMELVDVEYMRMKSRWLIRIFMDKEGGVTLDDCALISHQLGDILDVHDLPPGPYTLEISSPGLDRPLVKDADFLRYRGRRIELRLKEKVGGARHYKGVLCDYLPAEGRGMVVLEVAGESRSIPRELVLKANLVYDGESSEKNASSPRG